MAEPAIKSYFFGKGYTDLGNVITDSWKANKQSASDFFSRMKTDGKWWESFLSVTFWGGTGVSVVIFGTGFFVVASILHSLFLTFFFLLIYIGFSFVWLVESAFLFIRKIFAACPHCYQKSTLPEYLCDGCGEVHTKLMPNSYGTFYHKCICGKKLPSSFFSNRGRLRARCPNDGCKQPMIREHIESNRIFIPILGGPAAGKTSFLFAAVRALIEEQAPLLGFTARFVDRETEMQYKSMLAKVKRGIVLDKTAENTPRAFNLALEKDGKIKWLIYLYDPAGEAFGRMESLNQHRFHEYTSGRILILDPFSFDEVRKKFADQLDSKGTRIQPSQLNPEQVLERFILTMEESHKLSKTAKIATPLAVVISKSDAFNLQDELRAPSNMNSKRPDADSAHIRKKLIEWGEAALVQQLDARFKNVVDFHSSPLGRIPDASKRELIARNVISPVLWIFRSTNKKDFK